MKVLMLGWEFPPQISGGLGTACYGLSRGLAKQGVGVLFVIPRALGSEPTEDVEVLGADQVLVPEPPAETSAATSVRSGNQADAARVPVRLRHAYTGAHQPTASMAPDLHILTVDSPLRPYMSERGYDQRLAELSRRKDLPGVRATDSTQGSAPKAGAASAAGSVPAVAAGAQAKRQRQDIRGGYGPNLGAEVERYAHAVAELARTRSFDVIHAHDWMTFLAGASAARVSGCPLVLHVHACEYDRAGDRADKRIVALEQRGLDEADRVICVSEYTRGVIERNYKVDPAKLRVVHNAVTQREQERTLHWNRTIDDPIVLFLGRITYQKGPDYFLEAAARVLKVLPRARFVLSGEGDMLPKMIERAAKLGIGANVHFTGFLEGEEVERMYAMADLYVMPSVSEPFGISSLEAMALDIPVIVSRQSGAAEVLSGALKVDFWDVEDLAGKIIALLTMPSLRASLLEEGRGEVRRMRWEERGRSLREIYQELVS